MVIAICFSGERRLPACRSRQLAGYKKNADWQEQHKLHLGKLPR
jgi:hypothetical protein